MPEVLEESVTESGEPPGFLTPTLAPIGACSQAAPAGPLSQIGPHGAFCSRFGAVVESAKQLGPG